MYGFQILNINRTVPNHAKLHKIHRKIPNEGFAVG